MASDIKTDAHSATAHNEVAHLQGHKFRRPVKLIQSMADLPKWKGSQAYREIVGFIMVMNNHIKGLSCDVERHRSEVL